MAAEVSSATHNSASATLAETGLLDQIVEQSKVAKSETERQACEGHHLRAGQGGC